MYHKSSLGGRCLPVYLRLVQGLRSMVVWHVSGLARGWAACGAGAGWHGQLPKVIHRPYSHLTTNVFQVLPWSCSTPEESFPVGMGMISCQVSSWLAQAGGREPLNPVSIPSKYTYGHVSSCNVEPGIEPDMSVNKVTCWCHVWTVFEPGGHGPWWTWHPLSWPSEPISIF